MEQTQESNLVLWIVAMLAAIFAVRGVVRFDVNEWLRDRRKLKAATAMNLCPHVRTVKVDDGIELHSTFISPPGTVAWQCQRCKTITHDEGWIDANTKYWLEHPHELGERFDKLHKM